MAVDLNEHPGKNPEYDHLMSIRRGIMQKNRVRASVNLPLIRVPPQPNKYIPHIGAKQRAKGAKK